jgi:hypothetical protein
MRKLYVLLVSVLVLSFGSAFAQQETTVITQDPPIVITEPVTQDAYWATASLGYPMGLGFGFGISNLINNNIDVRFMTSVGFGGGFGLGADALFDLNLDLNNRGADLDRPILTDLDRRDLDGPINVYAGFGPAIVVGGADFVMGVKLFAGAEYRLFDAGFPEGGIFAELGPQLNFLPAFGGGINARVGFNYHF